MLDLSQHFKTMSWKYNDVAKNVKTALPESLDLYLDIIFKDRASHNKPRTAIARGFKLL